MGACYGSQNKNMSDVWRDVCAKKIGKAKAAPELKSISLTIASFHENVKIEHHFYTGFNLKEWAELEIIRHLHLIQ